MIYTRHGAPVEFTAAEKRRRWWAMFSGASKVFDSKPTKAQLRGAREVEEFDIWWVRANQTGPYPDGSGADKVGKPLSLGRAGINDGWMDETEFRADDGIREIHAMCERLAA
jgi:hypothetical protein